MASQFELPEELRSIEGINHWAKCYTDDQTIVKQFVEQYLIGLKDTVQARNSQGGYLHKDELYDLVYWKSSKSAHWINHNCESFVKEVTAEAFCLNDDWEKLKKLTGSYRGLKGVGVPVASAILHFYDRKKYPIVDKHALCTLEINSKNENTIKSSGRNMSNFAVRNPNVMTFRCERSIGRYGNIQRVAQQQVMADESLLLELERRGYDLSNRFETRRSRQPKPSRSIDTPSSFDDA